MPVRFLLYSGFSCTCGFLRPRCLPWSAALLELGANGDFASRLSGRGMNILSLPLVRLPLNCPHIFVCSFWFPKTSPSEDYVSLKRGKRINQRLSTAHIATLIPLLSPDKSVTTSGSTQRKPLFLLSGEQTKNPLYN